MKNFEIETGRDSVDCLVRHCIDALKQIAALESITEVRGPLEDVGFPEHLVKEGGWVPIHPRMKAGLDYAARMAKEALDSLPNAHAPKTETKKRNKMTIQQKIMEPQISILRRQAKEFCSKGGNETLFWAVKMSDLVGQLLRFNLMDMSETATLLGQVKREYDDRIFANDRSIHDKEAQ